VGFLLDGVIVVCEMCKCCDVWLVKWLVELMFGEREMLS